MQLGSSIHATYTLLDYNNDTRINLNRSAAEKDLGVWYSTDLKPSNKAAAKALKSLGLLKRTFRNINVRNLPFYTKLTFDHTWNIVSSFGHRIWLKT